MPELPEVHTITSDLKEHAAGTLIKDVVIRDSAYEGIPVRRLVGNEISEISRLAKNIVFKLSSGDYLLVHLAMTGRLLLRKKDYKNDMYERVVFTLEKGGKIGELRYCDKRKFGKVSLVGKEEFEKMEERYGLDPVDGVLTAGNLLDILKGKRTKVKTALMDQSLVSGIGNIYATEALWMSKIHPEMQTSSLTAGDAGKLAENVKEVLGEGISNRGVSMSDYVDLFGRRGKHQLHLRIYGKELCQRCKAEVEMVKINGRRTFFCPTCQKL